MKNVLASLLFLLFLGPAACDEPAARDQGRSPTPPSSATPASSTSDMSQRLASSFNGFGIDLFQQLRRAEAGKNLFISPLSIATALTMTLNGAAGETAQAMARTLRIEGIGRDDLDAAASALLSKLKSADPKAELLIANSLWARAGVRFKEDFLARNRRTFGAEIATLDFASPQAAPAINNWVRTNTRGRINEIVREIDPATVLFLLNAVYFKGVWEKAFEKSLTSTQPFHLSPGRSKPVPLMARSDQFEHLSGDKFQAVVLPYGEGHVSLYLFLPEAGSSLDEFLGTLTIERWNEWLSGFRRRKGEVKLPRFKMDYARDLNDALSAMGMSIAFSRGGADFSGMRAERDLFIQKVMHKAVVEVNEEGTEAAAVTGVVIGVTSARKPEPPFQFIADRPFFMAIRDNRTGAILFTGAVHDPQ